MFSIKRVFYFAFVLSLWISPIVLSAEEQDDPTVIRAAIDIGSGATKVRVAEINLKTNKIEKILANESFAVNYQESLERSRRGIFDPQIRAIGLKALEKSKEIANRYNADSIIAIATAAFRNARNARAFTREILQKTGIPVFIIDQELEGKLAFEAVRSNFEGDPQELVVWDIGGGSYQFSTLSPQGELVIYRGTEASVPFKNYIVSRIQGKSLQVGSSPNPIESQEAQAALNHAREIAYRVDRLFKEKIQNPETKVVGVGNVFSYGIYPIVGKQEVFDQQELIEATEKLFGKDDEQVGGGDFANVAVTNPIFILGFMQVLDIEKVKILDVNNADGAFVYTEFWKAAEAFKVPQYICYCY